MPADLVDDEGYLLVTAEGLVADESCAAECCGPPTCQSYYRLVACPDQAACHEWEEGEPPEPPVAYVCVTVRCTTSGAALVPGMVVLVDQLCWTIQEGIHPAPLPPGSRVVGGDGVGDDDFVQCVDDGCSDPACPPGPLYYLTSPCVPEIAPIWVCGVTRCEIRGCHRVDPSHGGIPAHELPPGAKPVPWWLMGPLSPTCCDPACNAHNCLQQPMLNGDDCSPSNPPQAGDCFINGRCRDCCCSMDETGVPKGRVRVTHLRCYQRLIDRGVTHGDGEIEISLGAEQIDANGCARYTLVVTRATGTFAPWLGTQSAFPESPGYCQGCGRWGRGWRVYGLQLAHGYTQLFSGFAGSEWGHDCEFDVGPGGQAFVTRWQATYTCNSMTENASYRRVYPADEGDDERIVEFEFSAEIVGNEDCDSNCTGRVQESREPGPPGGTSIGAMLAGFF